MRPTVIARLLRRERDRAKAITLHNGERFLVRKEEEWSIGDTLFVLDRGEDVFISFISVATIRILEHEVRR